MNIILKFDTNYMEYAIKENTYNIEHKLHHVLEYFIGAINTYTSFNTSQIDKLNPTVTTDDLDYSFSPTECVIRRALLFSIIDKEKREIYNDDVIFSRKELIDVIHFFIDMSKEHPNEEIILSKDEKNIYINSNYGSYVISYKCKKSITTFDADLLEYL